MSWKLAVLILTLGATACGLLVLRQQEIDALAAQTDLRREVARKEQRLQSLRWDIDELSRDQRLHEFVARHGIDLKPLEFEPRFETPGTRIDGPIALEGDAPLPGQGG
jgi:cell division protein FtsL